MAAAEVMDAEVVRRWLLLAADGLGRTRAAIDQLNVFPVPDADTGTNLHVTIASAAAALAGLPRAASQEQVWQAAVEAALHDACGNSGIILSQLLRGLAASCATAAPCDGAVIAAALADAAVLARAAVWQPVEGTLLTVADAAAQAAQHCAAAGQPSLAEVSRAAALGARHALPRTERQLGALAASGVVDAGGAGLCVVLDALCAAIDDSWPGHFDVPSPRRHGVPPPGTCRSPHAYEVTFLIEVAESEVRALAGRLGGLGDSLVVSGSEPVWHVHIHAADAGAVIETALQAGRPAKIKITFLNGPRHDVTPHHRADERFPGQERRVAVVAEGSGLARLLADAGAVVVTPGIGAAAALAALASRRDPMTLIAPAGLAAHWPQGWPAVEIGSAIQAIAALAVHDPGRMAEADAPAMRRAVAGMRWASVAGGDGSLAAAAAAAASQLTSSDTELLTILTGQAARPGLGEQLAAHLAAVLPGAEVICYDGGMTDAALLIGAE